MMRAALGVAVGFVVWWAVAAACGFVMRLAWPAYVAAEPSMAFDLTMKLARLGVGAAATLAGGGVAGYVSRGSRAAGLALGVVLVAVFIPIHIGLWAKFPLWYHLTFLVSLIPLSFVGAMIAPRAKPSAASVT
jgi:hypothetical protein